MRIRSGGRRGRFGVGIAVLLLACAAAVPAIATRHQKPRLSIAVLSGRANLVSGGSALVAINLPGRSAARHIKVTLGRRNVTRAFAFRKDGRFEGLVTKLALGGNRLQATLSSGWAARITLVNHPIGGPVLSGPQLKPWVCQQGAKDKKCNQKPTFKYEYKSTNPSKSGLQPYDRSNPPSDVAKTTTDQGVTVPFIVRIETGYMDRDQYQVGALFQPGKRWTGVNPQRQFDHKLLILHGASCGVDHETGTSPDVTGSANPSSSPTLGEHALGKGFVTMSTALDNTGHNCDLPVEAESLVMAKEHVIKSYGTIRYTIGTGCSGGSLAQQWIANAYPGLYQGLLPTCSFPDAWGTASQFLDYHLLLAYLTDHSKWGPGVAWAPNQINDVMGDPTYGLANAEVSDNAQFHVAVPTDPCSGVTDAQRYNPKTNPGGVRCTIQDAAINVFGPEPKRFWSANEKKIGHGFVRPPIDNIGVQYGLDALKKGQITPSDFVDLNTKVGGLDIDAQPIASRDNGASPSLARAYRSGMINETNNMNTVAIIDCRGPNPGLFHDAYRAFAVRARLQREHGTHANQLIWEGPVALVADKNCELNSFDAIDHWLTAVEKDHSSKPLPRKIISDKPAGISDECYDGNGNKLSNSLCPPGVVNVAGTPRTVAGDAITTDANKCQLKPLQKSDYPPGVIFTQPEWVKLQKTFPNGVCDYSKRAVDQQPTVPWMTYQNAHGQVIYGGRPLGKPPVSKEFQVTRKTRRRS
jgi:hypothetical protein